MLGLLVREAMGLACTYVSEVKPEGSDDIAG